MILNKTKTEIPHQGDIIRDSVNIRQEPNSRYYQKASPENIYVLIRRPAEGKTLKDYEKKYT